MIPIQLTLRNFLSYRDAAELDLSGIHLACISGANGAGKSTILDGITWALFGKSRVKSDDDIVNRTMAANGAAAEVHFTFELEGAVYRIIRRKAAGKTSELEFHARAIEDGAGRWQVRTEAKVKDTQAEIEKLLRMNFDVFTNASFLLQGKADEFTTKTPDKRKEILAEILGVSQWDAFKELATEKRKATENDNAATERQLAEVEAELIQEEALSKALELAEAQAKAAAAERDRQEALVAVTRQNKVMADQQRESLRRTVADLGDSEQELQRIEGTAAQRRAELASFQTLLSRREEIEAAFGEWQTAESAFTELQVRAEQHAAIVREMHPIELAIARTETQLEQRLNELEAQEGRVAKANAEFESITADLTRQKERQENLQEQLAEVAEQEQAWHVAQSRLQQIDFERRLLEQESIQLAARVKEVDTLEQQRDQLEGSRRAASEYVASIDQSLAELSLKRQRLAEVAAEKAGLVVDQDRLKEEMNDVKARLERLQVETECPFCGQPLTDAHRPNVLGQLQAEGERRGDQFRRNKVALDELAREITELEAVLEGQPKFERERTTHQAAFTRYDTRLTDIEKTLQAWSEGTEASRLADIEARLADEKEKSQLSARLESFKLAAVEARRLNQELKQVDMLITRDETRCEELQRISRDWEQAGRADLVNTRRLLLEKLFAEVERAKLAELEVRLAAVNHDPSTLEAARARRSTFAAAPQEHQQLLQAQAAMKPLSESLADMEQQRDRTVTRVAGLRSQREQFTRQLGELEAGIGDLPSAEAELQRLRETVVLAIRTAEAAKQKVEVLGVRKEDRQKLMASKIALSRRVGLLRQLEDACGRKGVQAMLIEAALPEIEEHSNELLDRLTGGEMRVSFDTQRVSKSKQENLIETLDISISDSTGERPYENYSGGEKFRINFAIRLALSQILAHRAGARLQTLVIDEGFGSQDPEGRQRLVEAINAVQDKFACILVITHIDELRDKFPARIDVEKFATGSRVSVVTI